MAYLPDDKAPPQAPPSDPGALIDMPWRDANGVWHIGATPLPNAPGGVQLPGDPRTPPTTGPVPPPMTPPPAVPPPAPPGSVTTPLVPPGFNWLDLFKAGAPLAALLPLLTSMSNAGTGAQEPSNFFKDNPQLQSLLDMSANRAQRTDPLHQAVTQLAMSRMPTNMQR